MPKTKPASKTCPVCLRPFTNRKKWSSRGLWDQIVYCSDACRKKGLPKKSAP